MPFLEHLPPLLLLPLLMSQRGNQVLLLLDRAHLLMQCKLHVILASLALAPLPLTRKQLELRQEEEAEEHRSTEVVEVEIYLVVLAEKDVSPLPPRHLRLRLLLC